MTASATQKTKHTRTQQPKAQQEALTTQVKHTKPEAK
jgi:hypothetical protein